MSRLKNKLQKIAIGNKYSALYKQAETAMSEYVRAVALSELEPDPNWDHDTNGFDRSFANVIENDPELFREITNKLIDQEIESIIKDYPYND